MPFTAVVDATESGREVNPSIVVCVLAGIAVSAVAVGVAA